MFLLQVGTDRSEAPLFAGPLTCRVPLQPQGLRPIVVRRCALGQDLDGLAEPLESGGQIPGLRRRDALHLQFFHLLQQAGVKAAVC